MSAYYDLYQTPNPSPEDGEEKLLHARILPKGTIPWRISNWVAR